MIIFAILIRILWFLQTLVFYSLSSSCLTHLLINALGPRWGMGRVCLFSCCPTGSTSVLCTECTHLISSFVPNPSPSSLSKFFFNWGLLGCTPEIFISNGVWPKDLQNISEAAIYEGLQGLHGVFRHSPGFWAVKKNCFHIWVEDFSFSLSADEIQWTPDACCCSGFEMRSFLCKCEQ